MSAFFIVIPLGDDPGTEPTTLADAQDIVDFVHPFQAYIVSHPAVVAFLARHLASQQERAAHAAPLGDDAP